MKYNKQKLNKKMYINKIGNKTKADDNDVMMFTLMNYNTNL